MTTPTTIALVTGANKGIGLETVRQLAQQGIEVLLGARDLTKGQEAAAPLRSEGLKVTPLQLDVTDGESIQNAVKFVQSQYGRLDILINNAGILVPEDESDGTTLPIEAIKKTYDTNVFGLIATTQAFWPLLNKSAAPRVVNLSSALGSLTLTRAFDTEFGSYKLLAYNSSKAAVNMVTVHFAYLWRNGPGKVNAAHPGYVATDINDNRGPMAVTEGAKTGVSLALLDANGPNGGFYHLGETLPW